MPADPKPIGSLGRDEFTALVEAITTAIAEKTQLPLLLPQSRVWGYLGISRSAFFRLKGSTAFPRDVKVSESGPHYRRADLDAWAAKLKGKR